MLQMLYRYFTGYLYIEITGSSPERFLNMCVHHDVNIWGLKSFSQCYRFYISIKDFKILRPIIRKTGIHISIKKRKGFPFYLYKYKERHVFISGMLLTLVSLYVYSLFIWNIDISGNTRYSTEELIRFLNNNDVYKTMKSSEVDTGDVVSLIRANFPEIIWVSTHVEGSNLVIKVKENEQIINPDSSSILTTVPNENGVSEVESNNENTSKSGSGPYAYGEDLVASEDGVIVSIVTRTGIPQVHAGDTVTKGDILISGRIDVTNDAAEVVSYNYTQAKGDVIIESSITYTDEEPMKYQYKEYTGEEAYKKQYLVGDYYIDPKIVEFQTNELLEISTKDYYLHPSQQAEFKFIFRVQSIKEYYLVDAVYSKEEIQDILSTRFHSYKESLVENGVKIIENDVKINLDGIKATAQGNLVVQMNSVEVATTDILKISEVMEVE